MITIKEMPTCEHEWVPAIGCVGMRCSKCYAFWTEDVVHEPRVTKGFRWVLLAENYTRSSKSPWDADQASDPTEVAYSLAKIDEAGNILAKEGRLYDFNHGFEKRLREAMEHRIFEKKEIKPAVKAKIKAVEV